MRVLVTGAEGFVGANLCKYLQAEGHDVVGTSLRRKNKTSLDALKVDVRLEHVDMLDMLALRRIFNSHEPEWVFHLAAKSIVRTAEADPYQAILINTVGTLNILEACKYAPVEAVVVSSSDKAYGDYGGEPYKEDMELRPHGAYGLSKVLADILARAWETDARVMVARCANIYGPGDLHWSRLVPNSCRQLLQGGKPMLYTGAWGMEREWMYIADALYAYVWLANLGRGGEAYNVGSGEFASPGVVALLLAQKFGKMDLLRVPKNFDEITWQKLDRTKLIALAPPPSWSLADGLEDTLEWYKEYLCGS